MNRRSVSGCLGVALSFATLSIANLTCAGELKVGASSVIITPPLGIPMAGYYSARAAERVHDDLFARTVVMEKEGVKIALVSLDIISTTAAMVEEARQAIEKATGIPAGNVMISATHAHTGPVLTKRSKREEAMGNINALTRQYSDELPGRIADGVAKAWNNLQPATVSAAIGHEGSLAFNRRFFMKDGTVAWNPAKLNPDIVRPAGPIDPQVPVVYFAGVKSKPLAFYLNYAVHLDNVGGLEISADLPGTIYTLMAAVKGPDMVTLYTTGCCGDINHRDVNWRDPQKGHENAARMGTILAGEAMRQFPVMREVPDGQLQCQRETLSLPLPEIKPSEIEAANDVSRRVASGESKKPAFMEQVEAFKVLDVTARKGEPHQVEVQVVTLGQELAWVSLPGEIFVELGLAIKKQSPFKQTMIAELANGSVGYIPTSEAWPQGNYEVASARVARGSGEMLVESAVRQLKQLHRKAGPP
jgi:hypothetical protein